MYNSTAFLYDRVCAFEEPEKTCDEIMEIFTRRSIQPPGLIGDLGAGTGLMSLLMAERGWHVYGVEMSEAMIAVAQEKKRQAPLKAQSLLNFTQGNICNFQMPPSLQLDGAICLCNTVNHLLSWDELVGFMQSAFQALRPGGVMVLDSDTFMTFKGFFHHEPTVVWDDGNHRMSRACFFDHNIARAFHESRLEQYGPDGGLQLVAEESMQLQYHLETDMFGGFQSVGFQVEGARPFNPSPKLYQGFFPKLLWVLRKPQ